VTRTEMSRNSPMMNGHGLDGAFRLVEVVEKQFRNGTVGRVNFSLARGATVVGGYTVAGRARKFVAATVRLNSVGPSTRAACGICIGNDPASWKRDTRVTP
jgi:hypothetical protein